MFSLSRVLLIVTSYLREIWQNYNTSVPTMSLQAYAESTKLIEIG